MICQGTELLPQEECKCTNEHRAHEDSRGNEPESQSGDKAVETHAGEHVI